MSRAPIDADAARRLVDEMADHLSRLPEDSAHAALREEVEQLRGLLAAADSGGAEVQERMRSVHSQVDERAEELRTEGIQVGMFLRDIGRMLGLD